MFFCYFNISLIYLPLSLSISCLFLCNPNSRIYLSNSLSLSHSILCISTSISLYLFVNPNSRLSISIQFSLSLSILRISSYICFYHLYIHLYFFIPLCQSKLMLISFYLFANPNSRLPFLIPYSTSLSILHISTYISIYLLSIHLYFFISLSQSILMPISFNLISFISA